MLFDRPAAASDPSVGDLAGAWCTHCGDPCGATPIVTDAGTFCCHGCQTIFDGLTTRGLGDYYACELPPGVSQRQRGSLDTSALAALDDPAVAARFVDWSDGATIRATLSVPDLHCASCLWLLERLWRLEPAILRSDVDLYRRTAQVTFRSGAISLRQVAELMASVGYPPVVDGEHRAARMPPARRRLLLQIGVAGFAFGNVMLFSVPRYANGAPLPAEIAWAFTGLTLLFSVPVLCFSAADYFRSAWQALRQHTLSLDVPVALGLTVLFVRSVFDLATGRSEGYLDSFDGLVFLLLVGKLAQQKAFDAIAFDRTLRSFLPLTVRRLGRGGGVEAVPLEAVTAGDQLFIRPSEVVPADSRLLDETGLVDYAFTTGEAEPVALHRGEVVKAGGRAVGRTLTIEVVREVSHGQLAGLWNHPAFRRPHVDALTAMSSRFAAYFTALALAIALAGAIAWWPDAWMSASVATAVLIIACPCAFTLAAPMALGTAMGLLGRAGLYVKNPAVVLGLSRIDTVAFDKTGTLTRHAARSAIGTTGLTAAEVRMAASLARESVHPVSRALAAVGPADLPVCGATEVLGEGLRGEVDGRRVAIGSARFLAMETDTAVPADEARTGVAIDGRIRGWLALDAAARTGVKASVNDLSRRFRTWLLSGDGEAAAPEWQPLFGSRMRFGQTPVNKLEWIGDERLAGRRVLMVGDGLNDAGALVAADVGVAVSDETATIVPAADAVISGGALRHLHTFLAVARGTRHVIVTCLIVSIAFNAIGLSLALGGALTPLATAVFMPASSLAIVGLAIGLTRWQGRRLLPS